MSKIGTFLFVLSVGKWIINGGVALWKVGGTRGQTLQLQGEKKLSKSLSKCLFIWSVSVMYYPKTSQ